MFDKIKQISKDTLIYGTSTIFGRLLNFLLVPIYTNFLSPSDYGITAYIYSLIAFLNVIYNYGMETAYFKYSSTLEIGDKKQNFSTPFISIFITSLIFSGLIILSSGNITSLIGIHKHFNNIIIYSALILFFDALVIVPFASLRQENRAGLFATIKFVNILINVSFNVIFLVVLGKGIDGIFLSGLIASILTFLILLPTILKNITLKFSRALYFHLLKFGIPSLPAGLAAMMLQVIDRPILRFLTDDRSVGIYQANYRLGIFMMLVVSMFDYAWKPFFFSQSKNEDSKILFARIASYFLLFMCFVLIFFTLFINDIVGIKILNRFIIHPDYWSGLNIVPIILTAYLFNGLSLIFSAGIYIEKKTYYLPITTITSAILNVILNFILIPLIGITGAALSTLFSYMMIALLNYIFSQKIFYIHYEYTRMVKTFLSTIIILVAFYLIPYTTLSIFTKFLLLILFPLILFFLKYFNKEEITYIRKIFHI
ncbi:MAG: Polysaccharide biosynthesis protein [Ignavibacteriae bacterium]|nr:MAG: Polysaccharide biosynthesis protein [Ignavibacteriota bacterium]